MSFFSSEFISLLIATFSGSGSAFFLHYLYEKRKENEKKLLSILYSHSYLGSVVSQLYTFKKAIVLPRVNEADTIKKQLEDTSPVKCIKINYMSLYMYCSEMKWETSIENLSFMLKDNPNVVDLFNTSRKVIESLNEIISKTNGRVIETRNKENEPNYLYLLLDDTKHLFEQVDYAIFMNQVAQRALREYGKQNFKELKKLGIKLNDEYKELQPEVKPEWESWNKEWFPPAKKSSLKDYFKKIRNYLNKK